LVSSKLAQLRGERVRIETHTVRLKTERRTQLTEITPQVVDFVAASGIRNGLLTVYSLHTTTAIVLNERQDALEEDMEGYIEHLADWNGQYRHNSPSHSDCERKNAASHLRALCLSNSVTLPVADGAPVLGTYQCLFFCELDGPRDRRHVMMHLLGVAPDEGE